MLIPLLAEHLEDLGGDARVRAHAGADDRDLADLLVGADPRRDVAERRRSCRAAVVSSSRSTVKERSASWSSPTGSFWMITSTLTLASASALKMRPATPGSSRTPTRVTRASSSEWVTAVTKGCSMVSCSLRDDEGTGTVLEAAAAVDPDPVVAGVLDRAQLQHAGARGRHLEHLLEGDDRQLAGVGDDPRVGAEDAGDVGVDLADVGVERGGQRDRGGVGAAASQRGDVAAVGRDTLEAGDEDDPVLLQRLPDAVGADVDDPRLGVGGVGDDARLRAGQRDRLVAHVVDRHRAERAGDPLAGREQHVHLAGDRALGDLVAPGRPARRSSCPARRAPRRRGCRPRGRRRSGARRA